MILCFFALPALLPAQAQLTCTWATSSFDGFEYTTTVPDLMPNTVYHDSPMGPPQSPVAHTGNLGLYLNFLNGFTGMFYDRPYSLCVGHRYRFSFWTKDTWGGVNNLTFNVLDANNVVISTQNVVNNGAWQNVVMPEFQATTPTIRFQVVNNAAGGAGNDAAFDDLLLQICNPTSNQSLVICPVDINLHGQLATPSQTGVWTGPVGLTNGYLGTFSGGTTPNGTYTYTIDGGNCADTLFRVQVSLYPSMAVNLGPDQNKCMGTPVLLNAQNPGATYVWGTGQTTQTISPTTTGNYYVTVTDGYGCVDTDSVKVTFEAPAHAGTDSSVAICSTQNQINLAPLRGTGANPGGIWHAASPAYTGVLQPNGLASVTQSGTFHFYYVTAGTHCPNDTAAIRVKVNAQPTAAADDSLYFCGSAVGQVNLSPYLNHPTAPQTPVWAFGNGFPAGNLNTNTNMLDVGSLPNGNYVLYHVLPADSACASDTTTLTVDITALQATFTYEAQCLQKVNFVGTSTPNTEITQTVWDFGDTGSAGINNPSHTYAGPGSYTVTYTVQSAEGCLATQTQTVEVKLSTGTIPDNLPNIITPDGDGVNNQINFDDILGECGAYEVIIYNRWGAPVFSQKNGTPAFEGKTRAGTHLSEGVYYYLLRYDGTQRGGNITLVR